MRPRILITEALDDPCARWLGEHGELIHCRYDVAAEMARVLPDADAMVVRTYTRVNDALLDRAPRLKVVGRGGVGLDNIDVEACRRRGVMVVSTPDANTQAVVEYVTALMLDAVRPRHDMPVGVTAEQFHHVRKSWVGAQLDELTLGILGFGRIGKRLGRVAEAIGMQVLVNDLLPESELRAAVSYPFQFVDKQTLWARSRILSIHVDGRASNRGMIDAAVLNQLRSDVLLINAARGMLVSNSDLAAWARSHPQAQVVLDVHDPEPPPADYPLYGIANVRLLPHLASRTHTAMLNMSWVVRDVAAVLAGRPPQYPAW